MKQNFIELITVPFNAGESKLFAISGQYFELIDATNPIDVLLSDVNGAQRGVMRSAEASFNLKDTDFATVQLYSATAQTIRFAYGTGEAGTRRAAGAVSIVGTVPVTGPLTDAQLRAAVVDVRDRPEGANGFFSSTGGIPANSPIALINPGTNTNGVIFQYAACSDINASAIDMVFLHKASPPTSIYDGTPLCVSDIVGLTTTLYAMNGRLETPAFVPAGQGVYYITGAAGTANNRRHARWRLL